MKYWFRDKLCRIEFCNAMKSWSNYTNYRNTNLPSFIFDLIEGIVPTDKLVYTTECLLMVGC